MLDHISLGVRDLQRSIQFYDAILTPLGYERLWVFPDAAGYGISGSDDAFAIRRSLHSIDANPHMHIAFRAASRAQVVAFYDAAISHGATPDGKPQLHPMYGDGYFAAFVLDPNGYRLESVYHEPVLRVRAHTDLYACITALELVHKVDGYPSSWPADPSAWLTPNRMLQAWVVRIGSSIVGHIAVGEMEHQSQSAYQRVEIMRLFVVPHARRLGIAKLLLNTALAYSHDRGYHPVLEVTAERFAAIQLYERAGWRRIATAPAGWLRATGERPLVHQYEIDRKLSR
jgi:ribosomal protein S18 acetylase RimI-like enzyme